MVQREMSTSSMDVDLVNMASIIKMLRLDVLHVIIEMRFVQSVHLHLFLITYPRVSPRLSMRMIHPYINLVHNQVSLF